MWTHLSLGWWQGCIVWFSISLIVVACITLTQQLYKSGWSLNSGFPYLQLLQLLGEAYLGPMDLWLFQVEGGAGQQGDYGGTWAGQVEGQVPTQAYGREAGEALHGGGGAGEAAVRPHWQPLHQLMQCPVCASAKLGHTLSQHIL